MNLDKFRKTIELYESFIRDKKIGESLFPYYQKLIATNERIIQLLETNTITPEIFEKFDSRDKWDISKVLEDVEWLCKKCKTKIPEKAPERTWDETCCEYCDAELTHRTGGGQGDPFNYTYRYDIKGIRDKKINQIFS